MTDLAQEEWAIISLPQMLMQSLNESGISRTKSCGLLAILFSVATELFQMLSPDLFKGESIDKVKTVQARGRKWLR